MADGAAPSFETAATGAELAQNPVRRAPWAALITFGWHVLPFAIASAIYPVFGLFTPYRAEVHVGDLYDLEARLFSVSTADGPRVISELVASAPNVVLDVITGVTYLLFLVVTFGLAGLLYFKARRSMLELSLGFLCVNVIGWSLWLVYPAAPPWYVDVYGKGPAVLDAASNAAGLLRLDALLGIPLTQSIYAKSTNVFGAMPSLHVAYATLVACVAFPLRGAYRYATLAFASSMAFSAVYLRHHYVLDVIAGVALAVFVVALVRPLGARLSQRLGATKP
jgi:membrane-associated phospholipid phosphatase